MTIKWDILDKEQIKRKIRELTKRCVTENRLFISIIEGTLIPTIKLDGKFFSDLSSAGEISNTSRIKVYNLTTHFFAELCIEWRTVAKKVNLTFNGWRDWKWLKLLCEAKKVALISEELDSKAIVVDGLRTDVLWEALVISSMFKAP